MGQDRTQHGRTVDMEVEIDNAVCIVLGPESCPRGIYALGVPMRLLITGSEEFSLIPRTV